MRCVHLCRKLFILLLDSFVRVCVQHIVLMTQLNASEIDIGALNEQANVTLIITE